MYILVGEYAGVEYYSIALLQKLRGREEDCLWDYVYPHGGRVEPRPRSSIVANVTWESAQEALSAKGIVFSKDQREAITGLVQAEGLVTSLQGPPGSSKSLILTSICAALLPELGPHQRLLWLTKTRKQRSKALRDSRHILSDPRIALGLGRSDIDGANDEEFGEWDPLVADYVEKCVGPMLSKLRQLKQELLATPITIDMWAQEGKKWKENSGKMHKLSF